MKRERRMRFMGVAIVWLGGMRLDVCWEDRQGGATYTSGLGVGFAAS